MVYTTGLYRGEAPEFIATWEALGGLHVKKGYARGLVPKIL